MIKLNILKYAHGSIGPKKWLNSFWRKLWLSINYKVSVKWKRYIDQKPKKKKQIQITIFIWLSGYFLLMKYFLDTAPDFFQSNISICLNVQEAWLSNKVEQKNNFFWKPVANPSKSQYIVLWYMRLFGIFSDFFD